MVLAVVITIGSIGLFIGVGWLTDRLLGGQVDRWSRGLPHPYESDGPHESVGPYESDGPYPAVAPDEIVSDSARHDLPAAAPTVEPADDRPELPGPCDGNDGELGDADRPDASEDQDRDRLVDPVSCRG